MNALTEKVRNLKYGYLMAQGSEGGYCDQFVEEYLTAWMDNDENARWLEENAKDGFKALARKAWGDKLSRTSEMQMSLEINGDPAPVELRYRDRRPAGQRVPGGFITVLTDRATVNQFFMAWEEVQRNANTQVEAAARMYRMYEWLLDRAGGDVEILVCDLV